MFNQFQEIRKNNNNPQELLNSITKEYTPEQMQAFIKFANDFGISNEQLTQYGINTR